MGKELILQTLRHEKVQEIPWVPFAGVHVGKLKNYNAEEVLSDEDKLVDCLLEANRLYAPDGMPVLFDLQVEAEILGCELLWAENNPPSVTSHPLAGEKSIPCNCKIPTPESGRLPMILSAMKRVKAEVGDDTALYGLICGPITLASHLRGTDIFMDMISDAEYVKELVNYCAQVAIAMSQMYIDAGMDVIAVVDPLVSQVSPKHIESLFSESFTAIFDYVRSKGTFSSFFVCGNASKQIEVMCKMNPDSISVDENVNLAAAKDVTDRYNITIGGNIPLTTTMLHGTQEDNMKGVIDLIDSVDHFNLIVSPGCDMPYDTPIENTIACAQAVKHPDNTRKLIENYEVVIDDSDVEIPDYASLDKPLIELFLLDPDQCAACTYMLALVKDNWEELKEYASEYRVYKYFIKDDIARTRKMGIANLPTMCINGEQKYISIIPSKEELITSLKKA